MQLLIFGNLWKLYYPYMKGHTTLIILVPLNIIISVFNDDLVRWLGVLGIKMTDLYLKICIVIFLYIV